MERNARGFSLTAGATGIVGFTAAGALQLSTDCRFVTLQHLTGEEVALDS